MLPDGRYRNDRMDLVELPEDLRRLKNQIAHLVIASSCIKTLPSWLNEFHLLETLELHHGNYFECPLTELPTFGIDQSPSSESHPPQTGILAEHNWGGSKSTHQSASTRVSCAAKIAAGTGIYNHAASQNMGQEATAVSQEFPSCIRQLTSFTDLSASSGSYRLLPAWISELKNFKNFILAAILLPVFLPHLTLRHLGSLTAANWVSFDFNVAYSSR